MDSCWNISFSFGKLVFSDKNTDYEKKTSFFDLFIT